MRNLKIEKLTLNIGVGQAGDKLKKAKKLLQSITNAKPVETITMKRIPAWKVRPKLAIGCKVTLRKNKAEELLKRLFKAKESLLYKNFDNHGNLSFGIPEYIDIPDAEYDPDIGIIGLEAALTLERPGYRIKRRTIKNKLPKVQIISKEESAKFLEETYKVNIE